MPVARDHDAGDRAAGCPDGAAAVDHRIHRADRFDDFRIGNDNAGTHTGQANFRQAKAQNRIIIPVQMRVRVDDIREGHTVGVIDNQWNVITFGKLG